MNFTDLLLWCSELWQYVLSSKYISVENINSFSLESEDEFKLRTCFVLTFTDFTDNMEFSLVKKYFFCCCN